MTKHYNTKKIQKYILIYSSLMMLVLGLVIALASLIPLYRVLKNDQQKNVLFALKTKTLAIKEYLSRAKDIALQISSRTAVRRKLEAYNRGEVTQEELVAFGLPILEDALEQSQEVQGITRLDRKDRLALQIGKPIPQKYWPTAIVGSDPVIWPVPINVADEFYLVVAAPIINQNLNKVGTDIILFKLNNLQEIIENNTGLGQTGQTILVTIYLEQIELISPLRKEENEKLNNMFPNYPLTLAIEKAINQDTGILSVNDLEKNSAIIAYGPIAKSDWTILMIMNPEELYGSVKHQIIVIGSLIFILILFGIGGMVILLRPLTGKMIIRADELEQVIQEKTAALNTELNERIKVEKELQLAHEELEKRVEKRTVELAEANALLKQEINVREIAEQELEKRAQELEVSNQELEKFAYVASHDLQEPLRAVVSYAELLKEENEGRLGAEADEYIDFIVDGGKRMQQLIRDLLAFSRIGTRGKPFVPTECEKVLNQVLKNLQMSVKESNAIITWDPLPNVMADPSQLTQLFQNLISNSIKFRSNKQPQIHISAQLIPGYFQFCVRDNGIGIEPSYAERIFVIFQRLHSRRQYEGTGIGLAICRRIVERHGGKIWVESVLSKGASFYFTLPSDNDEINSK